MRWRLERRERFSRSSFFPVRIFTCVSNSVILAVSWAAVSSVSLTRVSAVVNRPRPSDVCYTVKDVTMPL